MAKTLYYNPVTEEMEFVNNPSPLRENLGERFGLNGIKRVALAKGTPGGWYGDWELNYKDQMSFEEYKQDLDIDKNPTWLEKAEGGRIGFDAGGMAKLVEHVNTLKDGTVLTREYITDYISKNNIKVNVENFFNRVFPSERVKKTLKADTSFAAQYTEEQLKNIEAFGKKRYDKLDLQTQYRVRRGDDVGKLAVTQKDKYKSAYKKAYKFYKDKGVKIDDKVEEIIRKNISTNEGKFVEPKFSKLIYEGISSKLPDYTLEMLKKDLKAGKTSHQIAIEYFKANKKEVLKIFEGTTKFKQPLSVLSTAIGQAIKGNTELSKLYEKIIKDNSFKVGKDKAKYIKDIETLLPFIQEKGILVVDERGKAIKNAGDYFRYAYRTVSEPISKLFGYYETVGIEHPSGVARAVILEDANTLNRIIATIPETNTIKSKLDKYATGQAQFFKNIGDSKYIKNLNKITKKMNEEFSTPRVVTDVKKDEAVVRPMKDLSLTKPNLFKQTKGYIMQKLAAGGFNKSHFNKLAPDLQKAIKAFEGGNLIKGNKYLKAAMLAAGLVLTTAGTTREKGMTTEEMKEKTSQFLETGDEKKEAGAAETTLGDYIKGGAGVATGAAITHPKQAWEIAKKYAVGPLEKVIAPFLTPSISIAAHGKPDVTSGLEWITPAFWNTMTKRFGLTGTIEAFKNAPDAASKSKIAINMLLRAGIPMKALPIISGAASTVSGPLLVSDAAKFLQSKIDKEGLTGLIEEQSGMIGDEAGASLFMEDVQKEKKRRDAEGMDYAQGGLTGVNRYTQLIK